MSRNYLELYSKIDLEKRSKLFLTSSEFSQKHHLKEIIAPYPKPHDKSTVMIDDCDLPHGGKEKLVIDYLTERNLKNYL